MTPSPALSDIDRAPLAEIKAIARRKLLAVLQLAQERSPFYRTRLAGLDLADPHILPQLRLLTPDELVANSPPESQALLTGPLESAFVFRSGGTTGAPKFSPFSVAEFRRWAEVFLRTYRAAGLRSTDRVANLFVCGNLYASFIFVNRLVEEMECLNFPLTAHAVPATVCHYLELFDVNTLMGVPSWLLDVVAALSPEPAARVEKVFYAGEYLYAEERSWLHERLPNLRLIASGGYGAVDTGLMGYQCEAATGSVHHVLGDHVILEFVDPQSGQTVEPGERGLVLVTTLDRMLMPMIRYQIGDAGRWLPEECPCGRTMPCFELLGRGDDTLRIGYATLGIEEVLPAITAVPGLSTHAQIVKERHERKDRLLVRVERLPAATPEGTLAVLLQEGIHRCKPDLAKMERDGYVWPTVIEILAEGGIGRHAVTGKIRRVIDRSLEEG